MKGNDKTPKKDPNEKPAPSTPSSSGGSSSSYTTPLTSTASSVFTPISPGGVILSASRKDKDRADTPDATEAKTTTKFISYEVLQNNYNSFSSGHGILFLLRELGIRLLYNSDRNDYYDNLRIAASYQTNFQPEEGIDFAHKFFALVRNNHRFHKDFLSETKPLSQGVQEISFKGTMKVAETFESGMMSGGKYFETIDHRVYYRDNSTIPNGYYSYDDINSHLSSYFPGSVARTLKECFIKILKGENTELQDVSQRKFIYTLFYHLFAIEGARDPASYLTIPMAIEYLSLLETQGINNGELFLAGYDRSKKCSKDEGIIPICFFEAMRALSYMGDEIFELITSIKYTHAYDKKKDEHKIPAWHKVETKTTALFVSWYTKSVIDVTNFDNLMHHLLKLSYEWYGFVPRVHELPDIQLFQGLGMQAQDVEYDGNCFFHALNRLLHDLGMNTLDGVDITPDMLRQRAANGILDPIMRARVEQNGRWLDLNFENIAAILANLLHVNIVLVPADLNQDAIENIAEGHVHIGDADHPNNTIYIGNINNRHFVSLTETPDNEIFQQLQQDITDAIAAEQQPAPQNVIQPGLATMNALAAELPDDDDEDEDDESTNSAMEWIEDNGHEEEFQLFEQRVADNAATTNYASQYESIAHAYRACCEGDVDEDEEHALIAAYNGQYDNSDEEDESDGGDQDDNLEDVYFVTDIIYNNSNIYRDCFSSIIPDKEAFDNQEVMKLFSNFAVNPVITDTKNIGSEPVIVVSNELAELSYEQFSNLLGVMHNLFISNSAVDQ